MKNTKTQPKIKVKIVETTWNHRVLAHKTPNKDEVYFMVHEVYYNKDGTPDLHTERSASVSGGSIKEIKKTIDRMQLCLTQPILWGGEKFPRLYKAPIKRKQTTKNAKSKS